MSYDDPRLAAIYDLDYPDGPDHDFFRAFADACDARRVVDLVEWRLGTAELIAAAGDRGVENLETHVHRNAHLHLVAQRNLLRPA